MAIVSHITSAVVQWCWLVHCLTSHRLWPPQDSSWDSYSTTEKLNELCQVRGMRPFEETKKINKKSAFLMWGPAAIWHKVELLVYFRDNVVGNEVRKNKLIEFWDVLQFVDLNTFTFTFFACDVVQHRLVFIFPMKVLFFIMFYLKINKYANHYRNFS